MIIGVKLDFLINSAGQVGSHLEEDIIRLISHTVPKSELQKIRDLNVKNQSVQYVRKA